MEEGDGSGTRKKEGEGTRAVGQEREDEGMRKDGWDGSVKHKSVKIERKRNAYQSIISSRSIKRAGRKERRGEGKKEACLYL